MGKILTIDQGNTLCKVSLFDGDCLLASHRFASLGVEDLVPLLEEHEVEGVVYSTVAHHDVRLIETLRNLVSGDVLVLGHTTPLPIDIDYAPRKSLGLDRVAAAVGAHALAADTSVLVADAGTAITLDVVTAPGAFRCGRISPGLALRFRALHEFTDRLPLVDAAGECLPFGNTTEESIRSGVVCGVVSEIVGAMHAAARDHGCSTLVLTGGDAPLLEPLLAKENTVNILVAPDLVARGLNCIYHYNEDN